MNALLNIIWSGLLNVGDLKIINHYNHVVGNTASITDVHKEIQLHDKAHVIGLLVQDSVEYISFINFQYLTPVIRTKKPNN